MNPVTVQQQNRFIVYDADVLSAADAALFDPGHWRQQGLLAGAAPGRGTTVFIDAPFGPAVLRRFLRGGWAARISKDRYLFTGVEASRPFREFHLLRRMREAGLNVPAPIAALCERGGLACRGALLTRRIAPALPLADQFGNALDWYRLGAELRGFHDAGVEHADLNARNILLHGDSGAAWLVDFDRSTFTPGIAVDGARNLARLWRSIEKLWPDGQAGKEHCWKQLNDGYGTEH